jgi:hypothetical protein
MAPPNAVVDLREEMNDGQHRFGEQVRAPIARMESHVQDVGRPRAGSAGGGRLAWSARVAALLVCVACVALRTPRLLGAPRFWAEEGSTFFRFAYEHWPLRTLAFIDQRAGYLNLIASVGGLAAAHLAPLERAPLVTTLIALAIQIVPFVLVLFARLPFLSHPARRAAACAILLVAPTQVAEVWLNTINAPVYLGLIAFLLMLQDFARPLARRLAYGVLLFCGLGGVYANFLLPAFMLRAWTSRERTRWIQAAILGATCAAQACIMLDSMSAGRFNEKRLSLVGAHSLGDAARHLIGEPLLGSDRVTALTGGRSSGGLVFLALFVIAAAAACLARNRLAIGSRDSRLVLFVAFLSLFAGTSMLSVDSDPHGRYAVLPGFVLLFLLLDMIRPRQERWSSGAAALLLGLSLVVGTIGYRDDHWKVCDGRGWRAEVALWRADPTHLIEICPQGWTMRLHRGRPRLRG